ncbi:unnamed protein product [Durusdinium trenchii]|uniref:Calmodulin-lysine N-methyltransferase n=1 Tax=Durusdinium trenchii TaxID=1381693 RepID=A0ABP0RZT2_9DINO
MRQDQADAAGTAVPLPLVQEIDLGPFALHIETWPKYRIGSSLWPSGVLLAKALASGTLSAARCPKTGAQLLPALHDASVLELGAGPGAPGLAAARLGARVALTDYAELVPLMERNIALNQLTGTARAVALDWSAAASSEFAGDDAAPLDLILAADVVYFEEQDPLVDALKLFFEETVQSAGRAASNMAKFVFEQVGGRCKLMQPGDVVRCSEAEIAVAVRKMEAKMRKQQAKERKRQALMEKDLSDWQKIKSFLDLNHFEGVNAAKCSWFGFRKSYPLHTAAKEGNREIVLLLLKFGADRRQKDHHGRVALQYL